ncbi:MAG: GC-type dockerin domain-anchored protein, partial [Planctomycetota bacterium]
LFGQFDGQANAAGAFQNIPVTAGDLYDASAHALTRSDDSIAGSGNTALLKVEFYSEAGAAYDSPAFIGEASTVLADTTSPTDVWTRSGLSGIVPPNAVEARVTIAFQQTAFNLGGSVFVDSVTFDTTACPADTNNDGSLTPADFNAWVLAFNTQAPECDQNDDGNCNPGDFNAWILNFNAGC